MQNAEGMTAPTAMSLSYYSRYLSLFVDDYRTILDMLQRFFTQQTQTLTGDSSSSFIWQRSKGGKQNSNITHKTIDDFSRQTSEACEAYAAFVSRASN
jgi:hypothetical protein